MGSININEINVGDKVRIVNEWDPGFVPGEFDAYLNDWLGKVMTVSYVGINHRGFMMEETGADAWWFPEDIAEIIPAPIEEIDFNFSGLDNFIF